MDTGLVNQEHRDQMAILESAIISIGDDVPHETNHYFAHGTYTRELFIPAGAVITGRIHKYSAINIVSHGKAVVITDKGRLNVQSPYTFVSGAGVKKAIYAIEDTVLINVMPWDGEPDPELMEEAFTVSSYDELGEK
jgi:hypothetical protein